MHLLRKWLFAHFCLYCLFCIVPLSHNNQFINCISFFGFCNKLITVHPQLNKQNTI